MPKINPEIETFARIKVVGVGGSGGNVINHMISNKVKGVDFIALNTDAQDLHQSLAPKKIHIGKNFTRGLGAGMNPETGRKAAEETIEEIQGILKGSDMVFIACGLGGGTGTGAAPVIAKTAKDQGALTVGVVTKPFSFEGSQRAKIANEGLEALRKEVDAIIVIPNDRLLNIIDKNTTCASAFAMSNEILRQAVEGISDLITIPGIINVDFADIKAVMQNAGSALMGIGSAIGEKRAEDAAKSAINSPLLDISIQGARGVLFAIAGGEDMTMFEIQEAAKIITESIDRDAKIIFGAIRDDKLKKNEIKITVIASGFPENDFSNHKSERPERVERIEAVQRPTTVHTPTVSALSSIFGDRSSDESAVNASLNDAPTPTSQPTRPTMTPSAQSLNDLRQGQVKKPEPLKPVEETENWSAVPAFLRRNKLK